MWASQGIHAAGQHHQSASLQAVLLTVMTVTVTTVTQAAAMQGSRWTAAATVVLQPPAISRSILQQGLSA